jgi:ribonuclease BN (tRNA processing enzyme)
MRVGLLGSGTLMPDPLRGSPGNWVESSGETLLVDCGAGTLRALARLGLEWEEISYVFLTHFHTDHVADLAPLLFALKHGVGPSRTRPLSLVGPQGLEDHLGALEEAHGSFVRDPGFPLRLEELSGEGFWSSQGGGFEIRHYPTNHTENSLAYRVVTDGGSVGFTGDTGPDPGMGLFMSGVDLLVAECSHPDDREVATHLTPSGLAELALQASPELLVNVHAYWPLDPEAVPGLLRKAGYGGKTIAGVDGMLIRTSKGEVRVERGGK